MTDKVYIQFVDSIHKKQFDGLLSACSEAIQKYSPKEIHILLSSNGGNINLAFILFSYLRSLSTEIIMHSSGNIDSCAINLFLAGKQRYATPGTTFLLHGASRTFGKDDSFTVEKLYSEFVSLQKDQEKIITNILTNTNYSEQELKNNLAVGLTLDANEAKNKGIISEIKDFNIPLGAPYLQVSNYMK
jgi:ATP-dependent protease ClpP protease subunit